MSAPDLVRFAERVMASWPEGDVDGGELQDIAIECGLLVAVTVTEPCGEWCRCADYYGEFPATCYRRVPLTAEVQG